MTLQERIDLLTRLGKYIEENNEELQIVKEKAYRANPWFMPEFIDLAAKNIVKEYLQEGKMLNWVKHYEIPQNNSRPKIIGLVMAGNIPLVGFHDMLCIFISGHEQLIKTSSKDEVLVDHLVQKLYQYDPAVKNYITLADQLTECEVFIATGGNNTGRYFEYYFGKYPNIIRKNKTSVAILKGKETVEELENLADDIQLYFGLGCRNVTKLYVPEGYNFENLMAALTKYDHYKDFHKYRNNYDYQLALLMMGGKFYMTNESALLSENKSLFSAVSHVHYEYYSSKQDVEKSLHNNEQLQCIVAKNHVPFGRAQQPSLADYADGVDTMHFLLNLK